MAKKRAFVKYTKTGQIVPGSLIIVSTGNYPKGGPYKEVPVDLCCNTCLCYTITALVTSTPQYYDCNNVLQAAAEILPEETVSVCATRIVPSDDYSYVAGDPCVVTYECPIPVSDIRLKENIVATGGKIGQFNEYTWDWNETAKSLGLDHYQTTGVLAQEVLEVMPEATVFDETIGYYRVNYNMINNG